MFKLAANRLPLYFLINLMFVLVVGVAQNISGYPQSRTLYLFLLFALCSTSVIDLDGLNGRFALLALFMFVYFVSFGAVDLSNILTGGDPTLAPTPFVSGLLDEGEVVILVGGTMLLLGYRAAVAAVNATRSSRIPMDWSKTAILMVGVVFWAIGTIATYRWNVYIVPDTTNEAYRKGLASISTVTISAYLVAGMCQPLGVLLLAYAWSVYRSSQLLTLVIAIVIVQVFIGFVADVKGIAMLGIISVAVTRMLVDGRLPKAWLASGVLFVIVLYPYFTAYRTAVHGAGISRTAVVENFGEALQKTIAAKDKVNSGRDRAQTFLERSNVKGSVELIVNRAGNGVAYQWGYTLSPLLETFIPKIIWADKQRIPTGQLFNKQFHIFDSDDVYVSPSHLGELYWNFGWPGIVFGMTVIGALCGWVGARFSPAEFRTVTRILVTVITIKQLIVVFESAISDCYVVWLRSLVGIGVLHVVFARVPVVSKLFRPQKSPTAPSPKKVPDAERMFPNLLT